MDKNYPLLKVDAREVFGCDVVALLRDDNCDLALAPLTPYPDDIRQRTIRREVVRVAVGERHRFANSEQVELATLRDETLELWPPEMAPGYYDATIAACHTAGFEPKVDQHGAGSSGATSQRVAAIPQSSWRTSVIGRSRRGFQSIWPTSIRGFVRD